MTGHEPAPYEPASVADRAFSRVLDMLVMGVLGFCTLPVVVAAVALLLSVADTSEPPSGVTFLFYTMLLAPMLLYEIVYVSRRGYTIGKGPTVQVFCWKYFNNSDNDNKYPDMWQSFIRWAVPNVGALAVAFTAVIGVLHWYPVPTDASVRVAYSSAVAVWVAVYLSSMLDKNGRGWHDKAAGTIVVKTTRLDHISTPRTPKTQTEISTSPTTATGSGAGV